MDKRVFNDVKEIHVKMKAQMNGSVNYDSSDQVYTCKDYKLLGGNVHPENIELAKKSFIYEGDNVYFRYKVSSECIKHAMYEDEVRGVNSGIVNDTDKWIRAAASRTMVKRGYTGLQRGNNQITRKSPITVTAFEEVDVKRYHVDLEIKTNANEPKTKSDDDKGSTSLHYGENIPNGVIMEGEMVIDLGLLQFIPDNPSETGRSCLGGHSTDPDNEKLYLSYIRKNMGDETLEFKDYYNKNAVIGPDSVERAILLSKETVNNMVRECLKKYFDLTINRANATFRITEMTIEIPIYGTRNSTVIEINSYDDIDALTFNYFDKYNLKTDEQCTCE